MRIILSELKGRTNQSLCEAFELEPKKANKTLAEYQNLYIYYKSISISVIYKTCKVFWVAK